MSRSTSFSWIVGQTSRQSSCVALSTSALDAANLCRTVWTCLKYPSTDSVQILQHPLSQLFAQLWYCRNPITGKQITEELDQNGVFKCGPKRQNNVRTTISLYHFKFLSFLTSWSAYRPGGIGSVNSSTMCGSGKCSRKCWWRPYWYHLVTLSETCETLLLCSPQAVLIFPKKYFGDF